MTTTKKIEIDYTERIQHEPSEVLMVDANGNGQKNRIMGFYHNANEANTIHLFDSLNQRPKQFNIPGKTPVGLPIVHTADYNSNDSIEIYTFYHIDSLLLMDVIFPYSSDSVNIKFKGIVVDTLKTYADYAISYEISNLIEITEPGMNCATIFFAIKGSIRTYHPRKLYALDVERKTIKSSESYGNIFGVIMPYDVDNDGVMEIIGSTGGSSNFPIDAFPPIHDQSAWLLVFRSDLQLKFDPIEIPGLHMHLVPFITDHYDEKILMAYTSNSGDHDSPAILYNCENLPQLTLIDTLGIGIGRGSKLKRVCFPKGSTYVVQNASNGLKFLDAEFKQGKLREFRGPITLFDPIDVDRDGEDEVIIQSQFKSLFWIFSKEGKLLTKHDFDLDAKSFQMGLATFEGEEIMYAKGDDNLMYFRLIKNYWHYLKWVVLIAIVVFFYLFSRLSTVIQTRQNRRVKLVQDKMRSLELQSLKNQLDPHFTFNALNVLTYLSDKNDTKGVNAFTHHFSKLIRQQLEMSDKPSVKLYDELRFVRHYIELQKLRFDVIINYDEDIDQQVDMNLRIPKMMIHTHVENAIKHGLLPTGMGGIIQVKVSADTKETKIRIIDNGAGFRPGSKASKSNAGDFNSGRGLSILNQLYDLFEELYKIKIRQEIKRLENPSGTEVVITIPR